MLRLVTLACALSACIIPDQDFQPTAAIATDQILVLQRPRRADHGDLFQYTSYRAAAKLVQVTTDGTVTPLCCEAQGDAYRGIDISSYDLSFDARTIVFAGKLAPDQHYHLYLLSLDDGTLQPLGNDVAHDYVSPIFLPGQRVMFATTANVEPGAPQFLDEIDRGTTTQLGTIAVDGTDVQLGPRSLSHRTAPSLASDGRVIFTQWDAMGPQDGGHLMFIDQDLTALHEGYGKERSGVSNSTIRAREISPGRFVAIATSRQGTLGAGALTDIRLGTVEIHGDHVSAPLNQAEANATTELVTPDVPTVDVPSSAGRYHDAYPLDASAHPSLLVAWADGPVEADALEAADTTANFGVYRLDTATGQRTLILEDPDMWDLAPQPRISRSAPAITGSPRGEGLFNTTLIGGTDVYNSTLHSETPGAIYGVRVIEGYSSEEGFPRQFGTPGYEGQAVLGTAEVQASGEWSARIPANIPVHLQTIDPFGRMLFDEPVWISGRPDEAMICGGCHESRATPPEIPATSRSRLQANAQPLLATTPRDQRLRLSPSAPRDVVGVAWDTMIQPIFDAKCVSCHDGSATSANPTYTINVGGSTLTWRFDLRGNPLPLAFAQLAGGAFSASYYSLVGPDPNLVARDQLTGYISLVEPGNSKESLVMLLLNPFQVFPTPSATRAYSGGAHLPNKGKPDLTPLESYLLVLAIDLGANFYARENNPHQ